jgi:hypothetical protein
MAEEEEKARQVESQKYIEWQKAQEEKMREDVETQRPLEVPQGKPKRGLMGGVAGFLKRKSQKTEIKGGGG